MKLSELKGERAVEVIADLIAPITNIARDADNLKLFHNKLAANLGYMYENIVAQTLCAKGDSLFYHTFPSETSNHINEIDFIIARKNKICPLEIKSSGYKKHASLDKFRTKFRERILTSYVVYTKDYQQGEGVEYVPVYMAQFL